MNLLSRFQSWLGFAAHMAVCGLVALGASTATAQSTNSAEFSLSADAKLIENMDDEVAFLQTMKRAAWQFDDALSVQFSRPVFEIANNLGSTGVITDFSVTIGDPNFNFGLLLGDNAIGVMGDLAGSSAVTWSVSDFDGTSASAGDAEANVLTVDLTSLPAGGLAAGEELMLMVQLRSDNPTGLFDFPRFDQVFFGTDGNQANNSEFTINFLDVATGGTESVMSSVNDITESMLMEAGHSPIRRFFNVNTQTVVSTIPEPNSLSCLLVACFGAVFSRRVRR